MSADTTGTIPAESETLRRLAAALESRAAFSSGDAAATKSGLWRLHAYESVSSTMDIAKVVIKDLAPDSKALIIAATQTAGRGRDGRSWHSPPRAGIYATFAYSKGLSQNERPTLAGLSLVVGLAVLRAAEQLLGSTSAESALFVKWPNDVVWWPNQPDNQSAAAGSQSAASQPTGSLGSQNSGMKKLSGILVDLSSNQKLLQLSIGIGLNVSAASHPPGIPAISLAEIAAQEIDYYQVVAALTKAVDSYVTRFFSEGFLTFRAEWLAATMMVGRQIRVTAPGAGREPDERKVILGTVSGIDNQGGLIVESAGSAETIYSGDVEILDAPYS